MPGQYVDRDIQCADCGTTFVFSAGEQERFAELGFTNDPKRCGPCRAVNKRARAASGAPSTGRSSYGEGSARTTEFHVAKCADCGGEARVPFKPRGDRPVYCSSCFGKR